MTLQSVPDVPDFGDAGVVVRRRLICALDRAVRRPVTLVVAPAGYGKTTLLRQWAQQHPGAAWLEGGSARPWEHAARVLRDRRAVLVDDAHLAGWGRPFASACGLAGLDAPLIIASRVDPLVALHGDRLAGRMSELRADELAFTVGELSRVVARSGHRLDHLEAVAMHHETDGWPAGVRLAAVRSRRGFAAAGAYSPSGSYLMTQVVADLDPGLRGFLLATAVPEEFDTELAHRLSGRADALDMLARLAHTVGFVSREEATGLFHYHPMLRRLLLSELEREPVAVVRGLHEIAGRWAFARDLLHESATHAELAHNADLAADVAVALACRSLGDGDWAPLDALCEAVPGMLSRDDERGRLMLTARALRDDDSLGASATLAHPARCSSSDADTRERVSALTALCKAWLALSTGDVATARGWVASVDPAVDLGAGSPSAGLRTAWATVHAALSLASGTVAEVEHDRRAATRLARHAPNAKVAAAEMAMWSAYAAGSPAGAERAARTVRALTGARPPRSVAVVGRWLDAERGEAASPDDAQTLHHLPGILPGAILDALGHDSDDRGRPAARSLKSLVARCDEAATWLAARHSLVTAVAALLAGGEAKEAAAVVGRAGRANPRLATTPYLLWIDVTDALRTGDRAVLPALLARVDALGAVTEDLRVRILLAAAALELRCDDVTAASARLRSVLESTARHGWRRPWLELGPSAFDLLEAEHGRVSEHGDLVTQLLIELRADRDVSVDELVVALSSREHEILQYLPTSLDQGELCATLFISRNTLKTHLRAIYRKLGVESRREAVLKAQRVGLL